MTWAAQVKSPQDHEPHWVPWNQSHSLRIDDGTTPVTCSSLIVLLLPQLLGTLVHFVGIVLSGFKQPKQMAYIKKCVCGGVYIEEKKGRRCK